MIEPILSIGNGSVTTLRDGTLSLDVALFHGAENASQLASGPIAAAANAYLYRTDDTTMLIDAGGGGLLPGTGHLAACLADLDVVPDDIDVIFCTHLHPDHIGGLVLDGKPVFAKATLWVNVAEIAFWRDAGIRAAAPAEAQDFFAAATAVLAAYGDRLHPFSGTVSPLPNTRTVPLLGHTPGHTGLMIGEGRDGLFVWGDIVHAEDLQLAYPDASIAFDVDPEQAIATRKATLARVVQEGLRVAGGHLSTPGFGHIHPQGDGYVFAPEEFKAS
jgi:glyoxylase-like metal-dependent hydrolase (beta-lactamase superfamily II)